MSNAFIKENSIYENYLKGKCFVITNREVGIPESVPNLLKGYLIHKLIDSFELFLTEINSSTVKDMFRHDSTFKNENFFKIDIQGFDKFLNYLESNIPEFKKL
ncbi:hypothetical protein NBT05_16900 [Aquimarina sp. ERC-38]|uniref:hypothetical protein n=1 Tax=Aquimarina sp. ERC-38 TaxID=2949996 RepID=UPI0022475814|nr:hypothetical protein [Aquimarina sp. ERC-38]UZO80607.1 hypothetical protein NBT05_16900 [Aquimarina sp. ERC-38]